MNNFRLLTAVISFASVVGFLSGRVAFASSLPTSSSQIEPAVSDQRVNSLEADAIRGDEAAAQEITSIYLEQGNLSAIQGWFPIAAEDGDAQNEYSYAQILLGENDTDSQIRSIFWMKRALKEADNPLNSYISLTLASHARVLSTKGNICSQLANSESDLSIQLSPDKLDKDNSGINEILVLRVRALCGGISATELLVNYYVANGMVEQSLYFTTIGAENGSAILQLSEAKILSQQLSDNKAQERSRFWALRALKSSNDQKFSASVKVFLERHGGL